MPRTTDWTAIGEAFRTPFSAEQVKQRDGRGGLTFSYVDARDVENRLDEVVGPDGWSDEYEVVDPQRMGIKCRLTVLGVYKEGVGYPNNAVGSTRESEEPGKDAESDALKRAAVKFGIGRHLYDEKPTRSNGNRPQAPQPQSHPPQVQVLQPGEGRKRLLEKVQALCSELAMIRGKRETVGAVLRAGTDALGIEASKPGDLGVKELSAVLNWATTQCNLLQNSAAEPPTTDEAVKEIVL